MVGRLLIGVDCDEPLADCNTYLQAWHNRRYGTNFTREDIFTFKLWLVWGCSREESTRRVLEFYKSEDFDRITPTEGSVEGVEILARDHDSLVLTSRVAAAVPKTPPFIDRYYSGKFKEIIFSKDYENLTLSENNGTTKADICAAKGVGLLIEDCLQYALECQEKGIPVVLLNRAWNQKSALPEGMDKVPPGIVRARDWEQITKGVNLLVKDREKFYTTESIDSLT